MCYKRCCNDYRFVSFTKKQKMLGLYYMTWVDVIKRAKSQPQNKYTWPQVTMILMSTAMTMNFSLLMTIFERHILGKHFYKIDLPELPERIDNLVSFSILFVLPCLIANYLLIFHNRRYEKILTKYKYRNGKLFLSYFLVSMFLPIILLIVGVATDNVKLVWE